MPEELAMKTSVTKAMQRQMPNPSLISNFREGVFLIPDVIDQDPSLFQNISDDQPPWPLYGFCWPNLITSKRPFPRSIVLWLSPWYAPCHSRNNLYPAITIQSSLTELNRSICANFRASAIHPYIYRS
ncbi:hypothetical protein PAAG_00975 [Paracoccidioides lutzii Pb01]|uniref:Uncharacterized protein n=1 Tax=Paracoccidioides lutzii (strain ATCC MYA-826 / Pb01) TaxID=502779 RepID=C1GR30_PARBA|nr:hypothetical protein PAAG_00975 [Paracoccidioides lutzii Pb01]EEH38054.2 hypothetical protein PAAG_00975 [Paracoccidioides lutzii Pb01]